MTSASGSRELPFDRGHVWRALAVLQPYCAVCDVSYVVAGTGGPGRGTRFVCVPGRLEDGAEPPAGAPRGEIVEWEPRRRVTTRLELTPETWTTRIELADAGPGATRVTITVGHEPKGGNRLAQRLQRTAVQKMVQQTVDSELETLPRHVEQLAAG
ncbi:SRPBCC family protein [Geodermatophilus ruber]|uniref:Polyketide cyclase / dehydrase and lipid transport n=1 Tax=Geodermatophilus ruber TaxID=504800 RepID=A0A1I4JAR0_9ACTN|nr:SRPBCC family protein [Geodermatophilus ruber]SFL63668.1 Polyketide cyclase / dehydrase and lipid transport [Geodermatophilus ruber]